MKLKLLLSALILLKIQSAFSQSNNLSVTYGFMSNDVNIHGAIGDFGYQNRTGNMFGLSYTRKLTTHLSFETGLLYSDNKVRKESIVGGLGTVYHNGEVKMLTAPLYLRYGFLKYLFVNGGFLVDAEVSRPDAQNEVIVSQSGIGWGLGVGAKVDFGNLSVFVNPLLQYHALARFSGSGSNENLTEAGVKFGVGFNF